jgi:hypothetical protein
MQTRSLFLCLFFISILIPTPAAAVHFGVIEDSVIIQFPDSLTFQVRITNSSEIKSVVLEYGAEQMTCGTVVARAFPDFKPGKTVTTDWTWEMKQSGSLPPGATIWWRWRYTDENGQEAVTDKKSVIWLDKVHHWQTKTSGMIDLHWYQGDDIFIKDLLDAAVSGLDRLGRDTGLKADQPIDIYIYASTSDMKDAILYEPSWTGGMAFPDNDVVIIGIAPSDLTWGRRAEIHEITHVLVGHLTFSCLGEVPTWLNEGLAVYSEGELDSPSQAQLQDAIKNDVLLSVRSLSGGFSEISDKANLSYSESYSIVKFLVETYGQEKMTSLLSALRDGTTIDSALENAYGFDVDGLEDAWRRAIGAKPRLAIPNPTMVPTPTFVPTIVPVSGVQVAVSPTPFVVPPTSVPPLVEPDIPSASRTTFFVILCFCAAMVVVVIVGVATFVILRRGKEK